MANRKGIFKAVGLFTAGFVFGAIILGGLVAWGYSRMFRDQYYNGILSNANTAYMIRSDRQEQLLKNIETNIRQCVVSADSLWKNDEDRLPAFWYVQRYYQSFDLSVPEDIKDILDSLPPRPLTSYEKSQLQEEAKQLQAEKNNPAQPK
ncbi:MAG: hypothetical protein H8D56_19425 [Planctomycetes bacterium]|nr:hypothetical protein [Planctomycetota bacterium]MBL7142716.1 hypothetical protein [Phycisphaerae bacterium]